MTEEKDILQEEAELWFNKTWPDHEDGCLYGKIAVEDAYIAGSKAKAIKNVEFYQKQIEGIYDRKNKEIDRLSQHIVELQKDKGRLTDELTEAKEIIHKVCYEFGIYDKDLMEKAKQFLKE